MVFCCYYYSPVLLPMMTLKPVCLLFYTIYHLEGRKEEEVFIVEGKEGRKCQC